MLLADFLELFTADNAVICDEFGSILFEGVPYDLAQAIKRGECYDWVDPNCGIDGDVICTAEVTSAAVKGGDLWVYI